MKPEKYDQLLIENVTANYKLGNDKQLDDVNQELKTIASDLNIADRMELMARKPAFISLKDHKENFENNPKCRLINPAKSELGKISKAIIDRINTSIRTRTGLNQWNNSTSVTEWFTAINEKSHHTFISFDIAEFYPSISENLLQRAISWAKKHTTITEKDEHIIKHARKSFLFHGEKTWVRQGRDDLFDVTMGSSDGAEVCELVVLFILDYLSKKFGRANLGIYRDDGLILLKNVTARLAEKAKKDLMKDFEKFDLKITATANLKIVNFLDVSLDLSTGKFQPYKKPNDDTLYINTESNHPPTIIKQIPKSISRRISKLSSDQPTFNNAAPTYNDALKHCGYTTNIEYIPEEEPNPATSQTRKRSRKIIWFNPPYSRNVKANVGHKFLQLIEKHFPATNKLHKIFNRNTIKVSYSCMENMKSVVNKHNTRILNKNKENNKDNHCNCRSKETCPLPGNCMTPNVIYKAEVSQPESQENKLYIGMTAHPFKSRYNNHMKSFRDHKYSNETVLSSFIWKLKNEGKKFLVKWSIMKRAQGYKSGANRCNLCLEEKLCIMKAEGKDLLNKRTEIFSKCRHRNKFLINKFKTRAQ